MEDDLFYEALVQQLTSPDEETRMDGIFQLWRLKDSRSIDLLLDVARTNTGLCQTTAVHILREFPDQRIVTGLLELVKTGDIQLKKTAFETIALVMRQLNNMNPEAIALYMNHLSDDSEKVYGAAMEGLYYSGDLAVPYIVRSLESQSDVTRKVRLIEILRWFGERAKAAYNVLVLELSNENPKVRRMAASGLGSIGVLDAIALLEDVLRHELSPTVRQAASESLAYLNKHFLPPLD